MTSVVVEDVAVLMVNVGGEVFAYADRCPHAGTPLSLGHLEGAVLTCAAHEWMFDCRRGVGITSPGVGLEPFAVWVHEGVIWVRI
jgi:toluene monooxygenase system ferredoxin subunit